MKNELHIVSWNITQRCNLGCRHCYLPASANMDAGSIPSELSTKDAFKVIDGIANINPEAMLILSGGEPLLRKDIFELAARASGKGMMVVVGSNGLLIDDKVAGDLKDSGVSGISIGLDSVDPIIHDDIRAFNGAWEKAVSAVGICREKGLSVQINSVVMRVNYKEMSSLIRLSSSLGARVFSPFFLICTGRGERLSDISPQQYEEALTEIVSLRGNFGETMIRSRCAPTIRRILYQNDPASPLLKMNAGRCMAGKNYCRITPIGDVSPCPYMPVSVGNVENNDFADIWRGSEVFSSLRRDSLKGKCGRCEFRLLCGGCRARAYAAGGDFMGEDPWCPFSPGEGDVIPPFEFDTSSDPAGISGPPWNDGAEERLKRIPFFIRGMIKAMTEKYALERGYREITEEVMAELRERVERAGIR